MNAVNIYKNRKKILGLNARYLQYIRPYNLKGAIRIADNKILTKKVLTKAGIPTPKMIATIRSQDELDKFDLEKLPDSMVIKPVNGVEGGGIEIFYNRKEGKWIKADGSRVSIDRLKDMLQEILDGRYSLHKEPDQILIEERVKPHKAFRYFTYKGTPDVRVIVYNNIPVISYVRLPTKDSQGKANLKLGAIGATIDLAAGRTTSAVKGKKGHIEFIPHTNVRISGLKIPYWNKVLEYAVQAQQVTKLGYAAIDFLIDREEGPMIVELNARPGLSIQLAAQVGLRERLEKVKGIKVTSIAQGVRLGKDMFGGEIEESVENITGRQVIGIYEDVTVYGFDGKKKETLKAKIDTGADSTSIDIKVLERLGYGDILSRYNELIKSELQEISIEKLNREECSQLADRLTETARSQIPEIYKVGSIVSSHGKSLRPFLNIKLSIAGSVIDSHSSAYDRSDLTYAVIIGRNNLKQFLIDPSKK
jgi:alpha-L-glutamate ligase-like protein